jgi:type I restriction enzyme S subunit
MIEGLKPYAEYKESGERWLGQLPATWKLRRAKFLFREVDERSRTGKEELLSVSHKTGVTPRSQKNITMFMAASNVGHKVCRPQDLVINTLWAWMAALGVSKHTGIVSPAYGVYRPINTDMLLPRFADQLLRTPFYADEYQRRSTGVNSSRLRLYPDAFFRIPVVLPPPDEQAAIVRFLDHANRKIDGFIRAKRKLIGLLNEQKQAIIHRAVTRGLQPDVPLKPSGIPWLGDIPQHWEVRRLSSVAKFISTKAHEQFVDANGTHICVTARFVSTGGTARKFCTRNLSPASKGDVLMVMSDLPNGRALARAFLVEDEASYAVNQRVCIIRPSKMIPAFLAHQANRSWGLLQNDDHCNQTHLSNRDFKTLPLLCPPPWEQEEILRALDATTKHIPGLIARTEREIALMQEYRTRLTADLVTGKLDVREAAAKLPEPPAEPAAEAALEELLDEPELEATDP